jgi:hypothetical protein
MGHTRSVSIGPEFFSKTFNDYSDWRHALAREFLQNCQDAPGARNIAVTSTPEGSNTRLIVANDGEPMTEDTLVNKLLALGGSGKDFNNAIGGYGRAKELLLFCHLGYQIHTGNLVVAGSGAGYDLAEGDFLAGTESSVLVAGEHVEDLKQQFIRCITLSNWRGNFTLNGQLIEERLPRGKLRRDFGWAKIHTNSTHSNLLIVCIGGLPMFCKHTDYQGCVVVELTGRSSEVLQSSRDGLKWQYAKELDEFVSDLSVNRRKALQPPTIEVLHYPGSKLAVAPPTEPAEITAVSARLVEFTPTTTLHSVMEATVVVAAKANSFMPSRPGQSFRHLCGLEFLLKNDTGLALPRHFMPEGFGAYAQRLLGRWRDVLLELARLTARHEPFTLGFFISADLDAAYEQSDAHGHVLYVNPAVVTQNPGGSRSLARRWKFDAKGCWQLLATAIHEWVHREGHSGHDETFAGRQTDLTTLVLQNLKRFGRLFDRGGMK